MLLFGLLFGSSTSLAATPWSFHQATMRAAIGEARFQFKGKVMVGDVEALHRPANPLVQGDLRVWLARTDTGDKVALGAPV